MRNWCTNSLDVHAVAKTGMQTFPSRMWKVKSLLESTQTEASRLLAGVSVQRPYIDSSNRQDFNVFKFSTKCIHFPSRHALLLDQ